MSWFGNELLPAVMDALHEPGGSGEFRAPKTAAQLASWLRDTGCESEARFVEGMTPEGLSELLGWLPTEEA
jgi:hypothetical protein